MGANYENGTEGRVAIDRVEPELETTVLGTQPHVPHEQINGALGQEELVRVVVDGLTGKVKDREREQL